MSREQLPKDLFFEKLDRLGIAVTFEDVRLKTGYSEVMPDDVSLKTMFSRNVPLKIPIVSAAMDTVTEHKLAIGMALAGSLGIIHRNLSAEEQTKEVARVKFHLNALIAKPICVYEYQTITEVLKMREEKGYGFHSFPVLNRSGKLVGILTETDFNFCMDYSQLAKDLMATNLVTATADTKLNTAWELMVAHRRKNLPLVDREGNIAGLYVFSDVQRCISTNSPQHTNVDSNGQLRVGAAIGVNQDAEERLEKLVKLNIDVVVIDAAHADTKSVIDTLKRIKKQYPDLDVVAGNISQRESAERLILAKADGIKIGQGGGSTCITSVIAGTGRPQVTAVYDCAKVCDEYGVPCCSDGGTRFSGDITKAIGAGAWSVMLGEMLAGVDEAPPEIFYHEGRPYKEFRGMGSLEAMRERKGPNRYDPTGKSQLIAEGVKGAVPYRGLLEEVLKQQVGGLRRGMGYVGAATIQELRKKGDFEMPTNAAQRESHPHDLLVTEEPPNYRGRR